MKNLTNIIPQFLSAKKKSISVHSDPDHGILISVVLPVYNVEKYLPDAIESLFSQAIDNMEVIAINDGSRDSSKDILKNYAEKDDRIRFIDQKNRGLSAARNLGLKLASGKYIYFFDSDDVLLPGSLTKVIDRLEATGSDMARFSVNLMGEDGNLRTSNSDQVENELDILKPVQGEVFLKKMVHSGNYGAIVQKFVFLKTFLIREDLQFDEGFIHEDEAFTMEALCLAEKVVSFKEAYILKRIRPHSIMATEKSKKNVKGWLKAAKRLLKFLDQKSFAKSTEAVVKKKASQLILISLYNIQKINKRSESRLSLFDYIDRNDVKKLGFVFYLKVKFNFMYKAYHKIKNLFL